MKITKNGLQKIIQEELSKVLKENEMAPAEGEEVPAGAEAAAGAPQEKDVDKVLTYIAKIDKKDEYFQLVDAILAHAGNVPQGIYKLVALKKELPQKIKAAKQK